MNSKAATQFVDNDQIQHLSDCVEKLTHSGQKILTPTLLKQLKSICKLSDKYVEHAFHLITHEIDKDHAEIRFSAFQICDELFRRSHRFRELVVSDMRHIMDMTAETSSKHPLPRPIAVAKDLKRLALKTMQEWNKEFGSGYKKLQIGFNFLQHCKKVDFNALANESLLEQARIQERERRQNAVNQEKLAKVDKEMSEIGPEIDSTVTAMQNCIALLIPTLEDFFISDCNEDINTDNYTSKTSDLNLPSTSQTSEVEEFSNEDENCDSDINFREYGIINSRQKIEVNVPTNVVHIKESAANTAIIENARDLFRLLSNRYMPCIKNWMKILSKATDSSDRLKKILDLKKSLENAINKYEMLNLKQTTQDDSDSSDSDFEEVEEKDGYEDTVKEDLLTVIVGKSTGDQAAKAAKPSWSICSKDNEDKDPTSSQSTVKSINESLLKKSPATCAVKSSEAPKEKQASKRKAEQSKETLVDDASPSTSKKADRKSKLLAVAPKLPFDVDLYHWEDEKIPTPTMVATYVEGAQFWAACPADGMEEIPVPDGAATLRTRVIEFSGEFKPVQWACRAPLPNGKLCPRKDRLKCPFHGKIVPRDETGQCTKAEDRLRSQQALEEEQQRNPDWQDPELLAEIQASTGVDLKMPEKKGTRKGKKKKPNKYPGLTDIKRKQNTPHTRLSKKVFEKSAMKRISKALDNMDHKRYRDKYGDQFHYMYNTA